MTFTKSSQSTHTTKEVMRRKLEKICRAVDAEMTKATPVMRSLIAQPKEVEPKPIRCRETSPRKISKLARGVDAACTDKDGEDTKIPDVVKTAKGSVSKLDPSSRF